MGIYNYNKSIQTKQSNIFMNQVIDCVDKNKINLILLPH